MPDTTLHQAARLIDLLSPAHVMLAGAADPALAEFLASRQHARGAVLHIVAEPAPDWAAAQRARCGDSLILHVTAPSTAPGILPVPDLVFVAGDENYITILSVLEALDAQAQRLRRPFPVALVAGAGWPHGRRDGYVNPAAIPAAHRHPHQHTGLIPGQATPAGSRGLHGEFYHSTEENVPGIGVLTAVEDFLGTRAERIRFALLPGFGGLALLSPRQGPGAAAFAPEALAADALAMAEALDQARLAALLDAADARAETARAVALTARLQQALREARAGQPPASAAPPSLRQAAGRAKLLGKLALRGRLGRHRAAERAALAEAEAAYRLRQSPAFDAAWYLLQYRDVAEAGLDPALHYLRTGAAEGRDPGPFFCTEFYRAQYPDVAQSGQNPLLHYLQSGGAEGRNPSPRFAGGLYLQTYPDVAEAGLNPLEHWLTSGRAEGRQAQPCGAAA